MPKKKQVYRYVLSVDFEGGDGPDYFPIPKNRIDKAMKHIDLNFSSLLFASYPPPKVEIVGLTKTQWQRAVRAGERA